MTTTEGTVDLPVAGSVKKKYVLYGGVGLGAFILFRYYTATRAAKAEAEATPVDPAFGNGEVLPTVPGAYTPGGGGIPAEKEPASSDQFGFRGTTNSQWTQYAATQLSQSARWEYTDIVTALGVFLANRPLTGDQQTIVQAAIAVAGYPPEGSHVIIPGGNTGVLVAPSGLTATPASDTAISLSWQPVAGAAGYRVFYSGTASGSTTTTAQITGLRAATQYSFQVAALSAADQEGPKSGAVSATTKAAPTTPTPTTPTPSTPTAPKPSGGTPPYTEVIAKPGDTISKIAAKYGKNWQTVWDFNLKYRSAATVATLRQRGPNLIYSGTRIWVPK